MNGYKLIYHDKESSTGGVSPFDKTVTEIVRNRSVSIVCPYIGIDYFDRIIQLANTWRLVTDVEEWIISHNRDARQSIKDFILKNLPAIHHYKDIHAKVIVADDKAFIGSSNLTNKGITGRVEMGVLIEEKEQVDELQKWFSGLWAESESVNTQDLEKYISSIKSSPAYDELKKSNSPILLKSPSVKANLVDIGTDVQDIIKCDKESKQRLIESIRKIAPDREWINDYFDLAKEIIEFTGLGNDDPRLVMSITKKGKIPIIINQRYVLRYERDRGIGLIMPLDYSPQNYDKDRFIRAYDDGDEKYFYRNGVQEARWIVFERKNKIEFSEPIKDYWKQAVMTELKRSNNSGFKKFHEPIVYEAVMNLSYRNKLLEEVYHETF